MKQFIAFLTFVFILGLLSAAFILRTQKLDQLKKITIYLQWEAQSQFLGYYVAKEKGFFKDEGLDVEIIHDVGLGNSFSKVASDPQAYANNHLINFLTWVDDTKPVRIIGGISKGCNIGWLYIKDKPLIDQILGPRTSSWWGAADALAKAYIFSERGLIEKPTKFFVTQPSKEIVIDQPTLAMRYNEKFNYDNPRIQFSTYCDLNMPIIEDSLFGQDNDNLLAQHQSVLRAVWRGWDWAVENPEDALALMMHTQRPRKDIEHQRFQFAVFSKSLVSSEIIDSKAHLHTLDLLANAGAIPRTNGLNKINNYMSHSGSFRNFLEAKQ